MFRVQADAVGVVDEKGALKSWLSTSDMRGMSAQSMKVFVPEPQ